MPATAWNGQTGLPNVNLPSRGLGLLSGGGTLLTGLGLGPAIAALAERFQGFIANVGRIGKR